MGNGYVIQVHLFIFKLEFLELSRIIYELAKDTSLDPKRGIS